MYELPVELLAIPVGPVNEQAGSGLTVTVLVQVLWQPLASVNISVKVKDPALLPALMLTDWPVVDPLIDALAPPALASDQLQALPAGPENELPVELRQTPLLPLMVQATADPIVTIFEHVVWQPLAAVVISVKVKEPVVLPASTLTEEPVVDPLIDALAPPALTSDQLYALRPPGAE